MMDRDPLHSITRRLEGGSLGPIHNAKGAPGAPSLHVGDLKVSGMSQKTSLYCPLCIDDSTLFCPFP